MVNFIFEHENVEYATLFELNYMNKLVAPTSELPTNLLDIILKQLDPSRYLYNVSLYRDFQDKYQLTADLHMNGKHWLVDTTHTTVMWEAEETAVQEELKQQAEVPIEEEEEDVKPEETEIEPEETEETIEDAESEEVRGSDWEEMFSDVVYEESKAEAEEEDKRIAINAGWKALGDMFVAACKSYYKNSDDVNITKEQLEAYVAEMVVTPAGEDFMNPPEEVEEHQEEVPKVEVIEKPEPEVEPEPESKVGLKVEEAEQEAELEVKVEAETEVELEQEVEPEHEVEIEKPVEYPEIYLRDVSAYSTNPVDMDKVEELGDNYCKENGWDQLDGIYMIDDVATVVRCVHSDALGIHISIPYSVVMSYNK